MSIEQQQEQEKQQQEGQMSADAGLDQASGENVVPPIDNEDDLAREAADATPEDETEDPQQAVEADAATEQSNVTEATAGVLSEETQEQEAEVAPRPKKRKSRRRKQTQQLEPQRPAAFLHLVFDEQGGEQIRQSFELEAENEGEIIVLEDNYSIGPVANLEEPEGWQARKSWWQMVNMLSEDEQPEVMASDKMKLHNLLQRLEAEEDTALWIWMGQNERDVAGYYYVISQLMDYQGRIYVLYLNNLPFIDEKGHLFYPRRLSEILPKEFVKAARLARIVTLSEFELDPEQWEQLAAAEGDVRLLEGGKKLIVKGHDYYDKIILDILGSATMKLSRLLSLLASKGKLELPEYYLSWRVRSLIDQGQIISQGDIAKGAKNVSLKATKGQMFVELNPDEEAEEEE